MYLKCDCFHTNGECSFPFIIFVKVSQSGGRSVYIVEATLVSLAVRNLKNFF